MKSAPHILLAGGGAVGQVFPSMALASRLAEQLPAVKISFAGPGRARERHLVANAGYQYLTIPSQGVPHNPLEALRFVTDNVAGYCAARWMLREHRVSLVVGMGGHTSAAILRAAAARGIPFVLVEQNAVPNRTTRWFAASAAAVCAGFEQVRPHLDVQAQLRVTGNPARPAYEENYCKRQRRKAGTPEATLQFAPRYKRLVVLGGAGGARSLNESMPLALKHLCDALADWHIIHQTGEGQLQQTEDRYRRCGVNALAVTYIDEIASVMFESDLVICRASGTTLAELALAGVPAILVPYAHSGDDAQIANAKVFSSAGAARLVLEQNVAGSLDRELARELLPLVVDSERRHQMAHQMHSLARPQASAEIARAIHEILYGAACPRIAA